MPLKLSGVETKRLEASAFCKLHGIGAEYGPVIGELHDSILQGLLSAPVIQPILFHVTTVYGQRGAYKTHVLVGRPEKLKVDRNYHDHLLQ